MEHFVTTLALVGIVVVAASLLSGAVERSGVPLVAIFLGLGALLGPWGLGLLDIGLRAPALEVIATLALALVLFSDAVTLELGELRARRTLAWRILGPGTLLPALLVAAAGRWLLDASWPAAAVLGAALASTDPVLLRSLLRSRAVPLGTRIALRLETGMNDALLLPVVVLAMLFMGAGGEALTAGTVARHALGLFLLGPALGAAVGWVGIAVLGRVRARIGVRRDYESLYALGLAFSAFAAAEGVGGSGFLAAFAAGAMVALQDVELCDCFLEYGQATAEMLLLLTFVALGTSVIWAGLGVIGWRTLLFALIALAARTAVLLPLLRGTGLAARDRRLIALFGPRGLSSLLLALLPVFAGAPGAEPLFRDVCLVVLLSVVLHGGGIGLFLRAYARGRPRTPPLPLAPTEPAGEAAQAEESVPERIDIAEMKRLVSRGEPVVLVDSRAERSYRADAMQAAGAVRIPPDDPVRAAQEARLAQHATLVVYCA